MHLAHIDPLTGLGNARLLRSRLDYELSRHRRMRRRLTVFILDVDRATLDRRLAKRQPDEFGGNPPERELIVRVHASKEDIPKNGVVIDATRPVATVVDAILEKCHL